MEILRKNQKGVLEIRNTVTEMRNAFSVLNRRLDTAEERISELEDMSVKLPKRKSKENKE